MKILIIPEIREKQIMDMRMSEIETNINKTMNKISVANLASFSIFAPKRTEEETSLDLLTKGYFVLTQLPAFFMFDIYIGFLLKEDFEEIDTIIYESEAAKEIYEARMNIELLPTAKETIVITGEMSIENEVYKRTTSNNISSRN